MSGVRLGDGTSVAADTVVVGIGVIPNIALADSAGLELADGGVAVDATLRTSDPDIYAVGISQPMIIRSTPSGSASSTGPWPRIRELMSRATYSEPSSRTPSGRSSSPTSTTWLRVPRASQRRPGSTGDPR